MRGVLALPFKENIIYEHKSNGHPSLVVAGLTADGYTGEVVEYDGKLVHLMLLRMN